MTEFLFWGTVPLIDNNEELLQLFLTLFFCVNHPFNNLKPMNKKFINSISSPLKF